MRIGTAYAFDLGSAALQAQQARLQRVQQQIATGRRILTPAEDPLGAQRALLTSVSLGRTENYLQNMLYAMTRLKQENTVLSAARGVLAAAREAAAGIQQATDMSQRNSVADYLARLKEDLLGYANSRDANGDYLFAGSKAGAAPFQNTPPVAYVGDGFQLKIAISEKRSIDVSDPGDYVFSMGTPNDPFAAIDQLITDLTNPALTGSAYTNAIGAGLAQLDAALGQMDVVGNAVAHRVSEIEAAQNVATDARLRMQDELQRIESVDLQQAAVELQLQQVTLQALQQAFAKTSQLSLFNFL
jgi:flagellar hook-associated protein 3 FlgL